MSTHSYYQAIHAEGPLFRRLQSDGAFHLLFAQLRILGPGPFSLSELDPSEVAETLDWLTEQAVFATTAEADQTLQSLLEEISRATASDPEIGQRSAYIEQVHDDLEGQLSAWIHASGSRRGRDLVASWLYGGPALAREPLPFGLPAFRLVSTSLVAEGAEILGSIETVDLFPEIENWDCDPAPEYERWRWLYLGASRRGESVIVLTA